jgi:hypothetical protein
LVGGHLWLAWALLRWQPYTYALAIGVSIVEIAIIVTKFALFLAEPDWTIWTTNGSSTSSSCSPAS